MNREEGSVSITEPSCFYCHLLLIFTIGCANKTGILCCSEKNILYFAVTKPDNGLSDKKTLIQKNTN